MRFVTAAEIAAALKFPALIDAIADAFRAEITVPLRHHHAIARASGEATLLLMPAWTAEAATSFIGTKVVSVFPGNVARGGASVTGTYLLMKGDTGEPLAAIDGRVFTLWRTAASSALAARFLAREDATHLLMIGAGALAPYLIRAHASVRPLRKIAIWNRTRKRAETLAAELSSFGLQAHAADDLEQAVRAADIVSCATLSSVPLVHGNWLQAGTHLDLVGGFKPTMRETDDRALRRSRVYVDTRAGALKEAGDIVDPLRRGVIRERDIQGDLFDLCRGHVKGRENASEITLFKSVGTAIEDLATAMLIWSRLNAARGQWTGWRAHVIERAMIEVKICGINDLAAMDAALEAVADLVGLVFFPPSPRAVTMNFAAKLAARARGRALITALVVDADDKLLAEIIEHAKPDLLQLHGAESTERVAAIRTRFGRPVMKAIPVAEAVDLRIVPDYEAVADRILFDARPPKDASRPGGHGRAFDWTLLAGLARKKPMMLSGGLTPENVAEAIRIVRPDAVDVSSGVERAPGKKDADKIRNFVKNAREASAALGNLQKRETVS